MNKKTFDLALLVVLLANPAFGLLKMSARRWVSDGNTTGPLDTLGRAIQVAL